MRSSYHQLVLGALCASQIVAAEGVQKPLGGGNKKGKSPFTDDFRKHVDELLEKWHVPGMAIGVVDGNNIWTEVRPTEPIYSGSLTQGLVVSSGIESGCISSDIHPMHSQ